jgi:group I intron endonuclease
MEEIKYTIYKLIDPLTNETRYIGLTFNDLKQRLRSHCSENSKSHKSNWIKKLKSEGLKPIIESIEDNISSYDECCEREIFYIEKFKLDGHRLTNSATGGNKNKKMSDETRKKMSESHIERYKTYKMVHSEETKVLLSKRAKEKFENESEREKLRISNKRYEDSKTDEQRLKDILVQKCKTVYQYDKEMNLIGKYPSIRNAAKETLIERVNIKKCSDKKCPTAGGFVWRYEGDLTPPTYKYKNASEV